MTFEIGDQLEMLLFAKKSPIESYCIPIEAAKRVNNERQATHRVRVMIMEKLPPCTHPDVMPDSARLIGFVCKDCKQAMVPTGFRVAEEKDL